MNTSHFKEKRRIRNAIIIFIVGLFLSGITAFPIETELNIILQYIDTSSFLGRWVDSIYIAVSTTNLTYPFLAYGTDWLAFAHILFAILFIGPLIDPIRNKWVIQFGIIACIMIFPLAFIAGDIRSIPIFWRLIDCSFGIIGIIPLWYCYKKINHLESLLPANNIKLYQIK